MTKVRKNLIASSKNNNDIELADRIMSVKKEIKEEKEKTKESKTKSKVCQICGQSFKNTFLLRAHNDTDCGTKRNFVCGINGCESRFLTSYTLKAHRLIHSGQKKNVCSTCGSSFLSKGQLKVHERCHSKEKPFKCEVCSKSFGYRESLVTHSSMHTGIKPYFCECCNSKFSCVGNLIKHRRSRPETCGLPIYSNKKIAPRPSVINKGNVTKVVLPELKPPPVKSKTLSTDKPIIFSIEEIQVEPVQSIENVSYTIESNVNYTNSETNEKLDNDVQELIVYVEDLAQSDKQEEYNSFDFVGIEEVVIENSNTESDSQSQQVNEKKEEHKISNSEDDFPGYSTNSDGEPDSTNFSDHIESTANGFLCKLCPKIYQHRNLSIKHLKVSHDILLDNYDYTDMNRYRKKVKLPKHACKICSRRYAGVSLLKKHEKLHGPSGNLKFKCSCCQLYFESQEAVEIHQKSEHKDRLECEMCKKLYNHPENLHNHKKYAHASENQKKVTPKKYRLMCRTCGSMFSSKVALSDHERSDCGRKPLYKCETCNKNYHSFGSLKTHSTIHSGELSFKCSYCEKCFRTNGQKKIHERVHNKEKPYKCDAEGCDKSFAHRESLITHRSLHTGFKKYVCECCNSRFSCISNLIAHRRTHAATCGSAPIRKEDEPTNGIGKNK